MIRRRRQCICTMSTQVILVLPTQFDVDPGSPLGAFWAVDEPLARIDLSRLHQRHRNDAKRPRPAAAEDSAWGDGEDRSGMLGDVSPGATVFEANQSTDTCLTWPGQVAFRDGFVPVLGLTSWSRQAGVAVAGACCHRGWSSRRCS